jgi:hypothetical protein
LNNYCKLFPPIARQKYDASKRSATVVVKKSVHRMPSLPQWDCSLRRYTMRRRTDEAIGLQALTIHAEDVNARRFGSLFLRCTNPPSPGFHEIFPIASHLLHFADSVNPF